MIDRNESPNVTAMAWKLLARSQANTFAIDRWYIMNISALWIALDRVGMLTLDWANKAINGMFEVGGIMRGVSLE